MNIMLKGDLKRKALDKMQDQIATLAAERVAVTKMPRTLDEAKRRLRSAIEQVATPMASNYYGFRARPPEGGYMNPRMAGHLSAMPSWNDLSIVVGGKDKLFELLAPQLVWKDEPGMSDAEVKAKVVELDAQLAELQYAEEVEVLRLRDAGHTIIRRGAINPRIVRQVWIDLSEDKPVDLFPMMQKAADAGHVRVRGPNVREDVDGGGLKTN